MEIYNTNLPGENKDIESSESVVLNNSFKRKLGRKPVFDKVADRLDDLVNYSSQRLENRKIAELLGISESSFYRLLATNKEFRQSYEKGLEASKYQLEKALFKRAEGFTAQEVKVEKDAEGNVIRETVTDKHYVPDTTAIIFALKNIYSEKYQDKIEKTTNYNVQLKYIQNLSDEELLKLAGSADIPIDFQIE